MKSNEEIIHEKCKPYGGFPNVITNCGGSLVMMLMTAALDEAVTQYKEEVETLNERNEILNERVKLIMGGNIELLNNYKNINPNKP